MTKDDSNIKQLKQQVQPTQKKFPGLAIVFYTSKEIITNHQGTLWMERAVDEGATFNFTLPIMQKQKIHGS
ncbi:hypothetical protein [Sphingobacterium sp. 2149]|uniref:hypothetical protein n=1 Tax=Sphingobacterium sp. 2149 TaxID=2817763 RepID=UPI001AE8E123|nr:hypothetical protein [Sphingobacterium sp. 2149]MDR6736713.1 signal transduction histidine kinase [Sphingobacterium sp. 2149]